MLHRTIALAARGGNSQLVAATGGAICERHRLLASNALEILNFQIWHGSCSGGRQEISPMEFPMQAQDQNVALPLRSHTIFGICEAIGEDFGFNPVLLRVPFAVSVIWHPLIGIGAYLALGVVVLASRLLFPRPEAKEAQRAEVQPVAENEQRELAKAA
jgi:phage shock protein C